MRGRKREKGVKRVKVKVKDKEKEKKLTSSSCSVIALSVFVPLHICWRVSLIL